MVEDYLSQLREKLGCEWPHLATAQDRAVATRAKLSGILSADDWRPTSTDADFVVFGSLARDEWTSKSDVDWTLLIDGQAAPEHRIVAHKLELRLREGGYPKPGSTGTFGGLAFSHDIVHRIGGQTDTNSNTTQRVLLLLESTRIALEPEANGTGSGAYDRVLRNVLYRYLLDDTNLVSSDGRKSKVPRFLLNDIVRFWRTMCVDFAWKKWEQDQHKWALRNLKLRMSRKLIFVSGLLMCAWGYLDSEMELPKISETDPPVVEPLLSQLVAVAGMTPIQIVSHALHRYGQNQTAIELLNEYDWFLGVLNDDEKRGHLEALCPEDAYGDPLFDECREVSHRFQDAPAHLFFDDHERLRKFTTTYGVF